MQPQIYEFYVNDTRVYPHYKTLKKKYSLESGQRFFRVSMEGKITLHGADYFTIKTASIETELVFKIYTYISGTRTLYFEGTFAKTDCKFYHDKRQVELAISPRDSYTDILNNYDHEYNLIELAPKLSTVSVNKRPVLQIYCPEDNKIGNFIDGIYWESEVTDAKSNIVELKDKFFFELAHVGCEVRVASGIYKGIYAGVGTSSIVSYDNSSMYFKTSGSIIIDINSGRYTFAEFILTGYNSTGKALYSGKLNGTSRWISATLPAVEGSGATGTLSVNATIFYFMARYLCPASSGIIDGTTSVSFNDIPSDDFAAEGLGYKWCTSFKLTDAEIVLSSKLSSTPTRYGKSEDGRYFEQIPGSTHWYPIARSSWDYTSMWYTPTSRTRTFESYNNFTIRMRDGITIGQAIKAVLKKVAPNIQHEETSEYSRFLYGTSNPITGDSFSVLITQKSNILKGLYDEPAAKAPITLETIMNMLRDCFRCYWYVENNKLKIEHVYYFMNGRSYSANTTSTIDLTSLEDTISHKLLSYAQNSFEYDKSDLPGRYEFEWADDSTNIYGGFPINVQAIYVQQNKTENISPESFSSDIDLMQLDPNSFSNDGFALMCCKYYSDVDLYYFPFEDVTLVDEKNITYSISTPNTYATWYYLEQFYMYDMPSTNISVEGLGNNALSVEHTKKIMKQTVTFPIKAGAGDPDLYSLVTTEMGAGEISEMTINLDTKQVDAVLLFDPD